MHAEAVTMNRFPLIICMQLPKGVCIVRIFKLEQLKVLHCGFEFNMLVEKPSPH